MAGTLEADPAISTINGQEEGGSWVLKLLQLIDSESVEIFITCLGVDIWDMLFPASIDCGYKLATYPIWSQI